MLRGSRLLGKIIGRVSRPQIVPPFAAWSSRLCVRAGAINLQAAVHPKYMLGALNMKEEEDANFQMYVFALYESKTNFFLSKYFRP